MQKVSCVTLQLIVHRTTASRQHQGGALPAELTCEAAKVSDSPNAPLEHSGIIFPALAAVLQPSFCMRTDQGVVCGVCMTYFETLYFGLSLGSSTRAVPVLHASVTSVSVC